MRRGDVVTVSSPVETDGFTMTPGMVGRVWHPPDFVRGEVCLNIENGPPRHIGSSTFHDRWVFTTPDNVVPVTNKGCTTLYAGLISPEHVGEAVRLMQQRQKAEHKRKIMPAQEQGKYNQSFYDRWDNPWPMGSILDYAIERIGQGWGVAALDATIMSTWMTFKFTTKKPGPPEPTIRTNRRTRHVFINTYLLDRYYKGPMEGGTYRDEEWCIESTRVSRKAAPRFLREARRAADERNAGTPPISSVLSEGKHVVRAENFPGHMNTPLPFVYE